MDLHLIQRAGVGWMPESFSSASNASRSDSRKERIASFELEFSRGGDPSVRKKRKKQSFRISRTWRSVFSKSRIPLYSSWVEAFDKFSFTPLRKSIGFFPIRKGDSSSALPKVRILCWNELSWLTFLVMGTRGFSSGQGSSRVCRSKEFSEDDETTESSAMWRTKSPKKKMKKRAKLKF